MTCRVVHVLPHAGAGAQTYIDVLAGLDGFTFEVVELSASRSAAHAAVSIAARQPYLARAARRADLLHVHGEVASLVALPWLAVRPSIVTLHGLHLLRRLAPGAPHAIGRGGVRAIVSTAGRVICVSQAELDELAWLPGPLRAKLVVVHNGLPLPAPAPVGAREHARAALGVGSDALVALYVGQLEARKDPLTAVRAAQRARASNPRIELLVVGDGPCAGELAAAVRGGNGGVRLLGQRPDIETLLAAADVFVLPSLREGLSYAVLEALGHGLATIVARIPANIEAIGSAGLAFAPGDDRELAALLVSLAAAPARRAALGAAGRARIAGELSSAHMLAGTRAVYESALRVPGRARGASGA